MTLTKNGLLPKLVLMITALATIALGINAWYNPPAIYPDPSWGFQVLRGMLMGGGFNRLPMPSQDDMAKTTFNFLTWWSPGQYLVPYFFKSLFRLNFGQASVITSTVCELTGITGLYIFFKKIGFSRMVAALSIAFIASQQFYFIPYVFYNGGEVLLFAFSGWFLYGCYVYSRPGLPLILFVLSAGWIGFICKSSFMWVYAAGLLCLWINISQAETKFWKWIQNGIWIGVPAVASLACIYFFYLSKGDNPASGGKGMKFTLEALTFPLSSPVLSGFSIDEITNGLLYHPDGSMFSLLQTHIILLILALLSIAIVVAIWYLIPYRPYKFALTVFYAVAVLFFGSAFLHQLAISYEGRHFRIVGLLAVPGIVYLLGRTGLVFRALSGLIWVGLAIIGFKFLAGGKAINKESAHGPSGITQQFIDQPALDYLIQLDRQQRHITFAFISADIGLEIQHNRIITLEPVGPDIKLNYEDYIYSGHAGPLYILLPMDYSTNSKAAILTKCFPDYPNFKATKLSDDYILYSAAP